MNDHVFWKTQLINLEGLLEKSKDDWLIRKQLEPRIRAAKRKLDEFRPADELFPKQVIPDFRASFFLRGPNIEDSIEPRLAGEVLINIEKLYECQALHDERNAAIRDGKSRRRAGAPMPKVLFTGTPRGSFGFEFATSPTSKDEREAIEHFNSLRNVAMTIEKITKSDVDVASFVAEMPTAMVAPMKNMLRVLADYSVELRMSFDGGEQVNVSSSLIINTAERLERIVGEEVQTLPGLFRGLTLNTGHFDFNLNSGESISGHVFEGLERSEVERIYHLINKHCEGKFRVTTIRQPGKAEQQKYVLLDMNESSESETKPGNLLN